MSIYYGTSNTNKNNEDAGFSDVIMDDSGENHIFDPLVI